MCNLKLYNILAVIGSVLAGIVIAVLFAFGFFPGIITATRFVLVFSSVVVLSLLHIAHLSTSNNMCCLRRGGPLMLIAALNVQFFSLIGLIIDSTIGVASIAVTFIVASAFVLLTLLLLGVLICALRCVNKE